MDFKEFEKNFNEANKSELERKMFDDRPKLHNVLVKRYAAWLKAFKMLQKLALLLGYQIKFIKIKKS
jgi:hypothetical protein